MPQQESDMNHYLEAEAIMKALAKHFNEDEEYWGMIGLLHDVDWALTKDDWTQHTVKAEELLKEKGFDKEMQNIFKQIYARDQKLVMYVQHVIEKANIVKGSKKNGSGVSIGRAEQILGVNQWVVMSFVDKTRMADVDDDIIDIKKR